jgi:poly(3-hydroxybutyrate) depolymerase
MVRTQRDMRKSIGFVLLMGSAACASPAPPLQPRKPAAMAAGGPAEPTLVSRPNVDSKPSKGCGKPAGPVGERALPVGSQTGLYIVSLPKAYDPTKAYPLGFAFHGRTRSHKDCQNTDCSGFQTVMSEEAVLVYMQSLREPDDASSGWEKPEERARNLPFFEQVLAQIETDYCVDEQRIFLAGTSSGGAFSNLLGCLHGDRFLAIAPVSGFLKDAPSCVGAPAALVIHGIDDSHVTLDRGEQARENYRRRAGCSETTTPPLGDMHGQVRSARDQKPSVETLACTDYAGCARGSALRWCEHSYGGWDNSTHGWPAVGGQVIWDFVKDLPAQQRP